VGRPGRDGGARRERAPKKSGAEEGRGPRGCPGRRGGGLRVRALMESGGGGGIAPLGHPGGVGGGPRERAPKKSGAEGGRGPRGCSGRRGGGPRLRAPTKHGAAHRIHQRWSGVPKIFQEFWSAAPQGCKTKRCFCARIFPRSVASIVECPFALGSNHGCPIDPKPKGSTQRTPERFPAPREVSKGPVPFFQCRRGRPGTFYSPKIPKRGEESPKLPDHSAEGWWFAR